MASTPAGASPAPESPQPDDPAATGALAACPDESQPSRSTLSSPAAGNAPPHDRLRSRPLWKKILAPIVLAVISGLLFLAAIALYSSPGPLTSPSFATLQVFSTFSIAAIEYDVIQVSPSIARIYVQLSLPSGVLHQPAKGSSPAFYLFLPVGASFQTCPVRYCHHTENTYWWGILMEFNTKRIRAGVPTGVASANFYVSAHSFGYASNSVTAAAAIPRVAYNGPGSPTLQADYYNASLASTYDWSLPTQYANSTSALWDEPVTGGGSPGEVAIGVNQANQTKNSNKTFFAGALIGLAGGALLAAAQEALHAND